MHDRSGVPAAGPVAIRAPSRHANAAEPPAATDGTVSTPRLPRDDLLLFRGSDNRPVVVRSVADWLKRRAEIVAGIEAVMGRFTGPGKAMPPRPAGRGGGRLQPVRAAVDHLCVGTGMPRPGVPAHPQIRAAR